MLIIKILIISAIIIAMLILSYFTPIRYLVYYNILSKFIYIYFGSKYSLKNSCKSIGMKAVPIIPINKLKKYGLYTDLIGYYMFIWEKMKFGSNRIFSIKNGLHSYFVGKKNFWGKSSFLDPKDDIRYQLWNGLYIIPLNEVYELKNDKENKINIFGYDKKNKKFLFEYALLLIQYDVYIHFDFIYKYLPKELQNWEKIEDYFKLRELKLKQVDIPEDKHNFRFIGTVKGRNVMYYKNDLNYKAFSTLNHFGRIAKNNQENFNECLYKGDILASYVDEYGRVVDPESDNAKFLVISYSFGIHWEDDGVKKETSDEIMKNLVDSYVNLKYEPIK